MTVVFLFGADGAFRDDSDLFYLARTAALCRGDEGAFVFAAQYRR